MKTITRGDRVVDRDGNEGIVVKIHRRYSDIENHGTIYVWQLNRQNYGIDNCKHYPYHNWEQNLKIMQDEAVVVEQDTDNSQYLREGFFKHKPSKIRNRI